MTDTPKPCIVISPIGEEKSETRMRSDQVLKHLITPAAEECGYKAVRADQISDPGMITSQIIQRIIDDPLVIADLSEENPNVFYELAIRHAIKKPLVQIIQKGQKPPFDVAGMRTIPVDHHDLDSVAEAKQEMVKQIKSAESKPEAMETPISRAIDLQNLTQSGDPNDRHFADILEGISDIRSEMRMTRQSIESADTRAQLSNFYSGRKKQPSSFDISEVLLKSPYGKLPSEKDTAKILRKLTALYNESPKEPTEDEDESDI